MKKSVFKLNDRQIRALRSAGVVLCYLHGSVPMGAAREDSDADVAVLFEKTPSDPFEATAAVHGALSGLVSGRKLDVAILNDASPLLKQIVASTGTLLYERSPGDRLSFELRAMHEYEYSKRVVQLGEDIHLMRLDARLRLKNA